MLPIEDEEWRYNLSGLSLAVSQRQDILTLEIQHAGFCSAWNRTEQNRTEQKDLEISCDKRNNGCVEVERKIKFLVTNRGEVNYNTKRHFTLTLSQTGLKMFFSHIRLCKYFIGVAFPVVLEVEGRDLSRRYTVLRLFTHKKHSFIANSTAYRIEMMKHFKAVTSL
jgi:hypothetical protein